MCVCVCGNLDLLIGQLCTVATASAVDDVVCVGPLRNVLSGYYSMIIVYQQQFGTLYE